MKISLITILIIVILSLGLIACGHAGLASPAESSCNVSTSCKLQSCLHISNAVTRNSMFRKNLSDAALIDIRLITQKSQDILVFPDFAPTSTKGGVHF